MQLNDTRIQEFGRNDGVRSIFHCQEKFLILSRLCIQNPGSVDTEDFTVNFYLLTLAFEGMLRIHEPTELYF